MMRTRLNLSRNPFTNHRLFWLGVAAVFFISLWLFLWVSAEKSRVIAEAYRLSTRNEQLKAQVQEQQQQAEALRQEQEKQKIELTDQQRKELASARLLIGRKTLSMNRLISDLEKYVPDKARITDVKIEEVFTAGQDALATVEVRAAGPTAEQMKEMMVSLEKSGGLFEFNGPASQDAMNDQNEIPFTLKLLYRRSGGGAQ